MDKILTLLFCFCFCFLSCERNNVVVQTNTTDDHLIVEDLCSVEFERNNEGTLLSHRPRGLKGRRPIHSTLTTWDVRATVTCHPGYDFSNATLMGEPLECSDYNTAFILGQEVPCELHYLEGQAFYLFTIDHLETVVAFLARNGLSYIDDEGENEDVQILH